MISPEAGSTVDEIDALLPQTQCTKCGYPACRPYAEAIACGQADIDRCPPGGAAGIAALATLLGRPAKPLDPTAGAEQPRMAALIREERCIGCTLCISACPVDAIIGAAKQMHSILLEACTGCELCLPPCPVDCIDMLTMTELARRGSHGAAREAQVPVAQHAARWRARYRAHLARSTRAGAQSMATRSAHKSDASPRLEHKRAAVRAALARARARRARSGPPQ